MKKLFIYSANENVITRLKSDLENSHYDVAYFSLLSELKAALRAQELVSLIFHLDNHTDAEGELEIIQREYRQQINTLVLNNTPDPEQGVRLLNLNVRGYSNTFIEPDKLIVALNVIEQGEIWAGAALIQYMLNKSTLNEQNSNKDSEQDQAIFKLLTSREQQIAQKILTGLQNKLIADELSITERTVKAHLSTIFKKLGVRNRLELTLKLQKADRRSHS